MKSCTHLHEKIEYERPIILREHPQREERNEYLCSHPSYLEILGKTFCESLCPDRERCDWK